MARKASLRQGTDGDLQRARRFLRELKSTSGQGVDNLAQKVDFIYKVFFREEGLDGLEAARNVIDTRLSVPRETLFLPTAQALTYSKNFKGLHAFLDEMEGLDGNTSQLYMPRVHAHLHQGDVAQARQVAWSNLHSAPPEPIRRQLVAMLLQMGELDALLREDPSLRASYPIFQRAEVLSPPDEKGEVPVFCINLDRDEERLERARFFQSGGTTFHRSPGVSGSSLPRTILEATGLSITVPRIAQVGCHLAHMKAWEAVTDTVPEGAFGLVTEDDAVFMHGPGRGLSQALQLAHGHDVDLLFINFEPMRHRPFVATDTPELLTIDEALTQIYPKRVPGWGGESYLLTPKGARQLIEMSSEIGIVGALDWQIALYGAEHVDPAEIMEIGPVESILRPLAAARARHGAAFVMRAGVLSVPLMRQLDMGYTAHHLEVSLAAA